jgi:Ftsk/SpoIIIE family protein
MVFSFLTKQNNKHSEENILREVFRDKINIPTLEMLVGLNDEGKPVTYDLATAPHLLTAGTTGSGAQKSINTMYLSLMEHNNPDDLKLIIIDNFGTEFNSYNKSPFMLTDVITDLQKSLGAFRFLVQEMEVREKLLDQFHARNLETYNSKVPDIMKRPRIVFYVDEIAILMYRYGDEIEDIMSRLGAKARSVGITVHINTRFPNKDIIKGRVKCNLDSKIAYKLSSKIESDIVLGELGAETLLGKGDSYVRWSDYANLVHVQGIYLSDEETNSFIDSIVNKFPDEKYYNRIEF